MKILKVIKDELKNLKPSEIIFVSILLCVIGFNSFVLKDNLISIIYAIAGILYTILAGKGRIYCYIFGLISSFCYGYLAYKHKLYGNFALNLCYYIPMQIWGIFQWKKHLKKDSAEIFKTKLNNTPKVIITILTAILWISVYFILNSLGDTSPLLDSCATSVSLIGMYLTVKRCIEQWIAWAIVNLSTLIIWINVVLNGEKNFSTVIVWLTYLILAIYFYKEWENEIYPSKK